MFLDLRRHSSAHNLFHDKLLTQYWYAIYHPSLNIAFECYFHLHLCISVIVDFTTLPHLKTKTILNVENDMMLALMETQKPIFFSLLMCYIFNHPIKYIVCYIFFYTFDIFGIKLKNLFLMCFVLPY